MPHAQRRADSPLARTFAPFLRDLTGTPPLDADEEQELAWRIEDGDPEARDHMVRANLRLVVTIARGYAGNGLPLEDLVAEGSLGLIRAAEDFDPSVGVRFSVYAAHWVRQSIRRALLNTAKPVRLPAHMANLLTRWRRATAALLVELGREPELEEVAARLGLPAKKLKIVRKALRVHGGAAQEGAGGAPLGELPAGDAAPDVRLEEDEEMGLALRLLHRLDPRDAGVLRLRFGMGAEGPLTLREIGDRLGLTRERVRQIEADALAKLRQALSG